MGETYSQHPVEESAEPPWCVAAEGNSLPTTSTNTVTTFEKSFTSKDPNSPGHPPHGLANITATSWRDEYQFSHTLTADEVSQRLDVNPEHGLSATEAESRLRRDGLNKVEDAKGLSLWKILLRQASNSLTLVLVITMALSYGIHDYIEGGVITAVILLNIIVGFVQDYHAEKQIMSLYALSAPMSKVIRDGQLVTIKAEQLVVGDVVKLAVGDIVPADLRLIEGMNAATDEALLTGESLPVTKTPDAVFANRNMPVGDRTNLAYSASTMSAGRATGIVISTGMDTEVGNIAGLLRKQEVEEFHSNPVIRLLQRAQRSMKVILGLVGTPLQVKLSKFALLLFALAILLAVIVFSASKWDIQGEVLIYGICVAVAVIPESLIAVLTVTMAIGTKAMAGGNVIVRKLQALEAVGGITAICSDKTGTLTQGKMIARKAWIPDFGNISIHETTRPFDPTSGNVHMNDKVVDIGAAKSLESVSQFLDAIALCNLSSVFKTNPTESMPEEWSAVGEPTEIALHVFAMRFKNGKTSLLESGDRKQIAEFAFDSSCKRMTVVYQLVATGEVTAYSKGAPEVMLPLLSSSEQEKTEISAMVEKMAGEGLRVLCIGQRAIENLNDSQPLSRQSVEININFLGLIGLYDPPRVETADAVRRCQQAGITVHMLTGDHIRTATAIAYEVGILGPSLTRAQAGSAIMPAEEFDKLTDLEIDAIETLPLVLARCSPSTKVRMVEAMHRRREYCAMTGDGVNDSPALKRADIGIAMGLNGSDVAKEAADMVLTDDNFASIVKAVEEGRRLFDNIQKFLLHLLISNISQVILLLIGLSFKDANNHSVFPLSPLEILWVNLITSSFLALGLGLEEVQPDIMSRPPHDLHVGVFTRELIVDKFIYGTFMGCLCLVAFVSVTYGAGDGALGMDCNEGWNESCDVVFRARSTTYATLTFLLLVTAWEVKHFSRSLFNFDPTRYSGPFSIFPTVWRNRFLFWAVVAGFVIAFPVVYLPFVNKEVFKHSAITWEWGIVVGCLATYVALVESWKAMKRRFGTASRKHERQQQV